MNEKFPSMLLEENFFPREITAIKSHFQKQGRQFKKQNKKKTN